MVLTWLTGSNKQINILMLILKNYRKKYNPTDPELVILLARSQNLSMVKLDKCGLGKNEADLLTLALDPTSIIFLNKLNKFLN